MRLVTGIKNARDVVRAGSLHLDKPLLRAELFINHRVSARQFLAEMLPKGGVGAEIGVFTGLFSTKLLDIAKPRHAYFVDPWWKAFGLSYPDWGGYTDYGRLSTKTAHSIASSRINSHARAAKTDVLVEYSTGFLAQMPDASFDWIYLDSTHSYEGTVQELKLIRPKLKPDAILAGDDWHNDADHGHYGVTSAVREAVSRGEYKLIASSEQLQWAVRPA